MNKFDRVVAIFILLQSRKKITAQEIADRFEVSLRTVYRDIRTLETAGVPVCGEAGRGYALVDGFKLPPVMFDPLEAISLIIAEKFIPSNTDQIWLKAYDSALTKIKAVLDDEAKANAERLTESVVLRDPKEKPHEPFLSELFAAIASKKLLQIEYQKNDGAAAEWREIEPTGCYYHFESWYCIAWCRLRKDYRTFKVKRIKNVKETNEVFDGNHPSVDAYLKAEAAQKLQHLVEVYFPKEMIEYVENDRFMFGLVGREEEKDGWVKMRYLVSDYYMIARWVMKYTKHVRIVDQPELKAVIKRMVLDLNEVYL